MTAFCITVTPAPEPGSACLCSARKGGSRVKPGMTIEVRG